jgi:tetratricopeptide (TPR) repeat protein
MKKYLFLLIFTLLSVQSAIGETVQINSDEQFEFAEHYFSTGEYAKAIAEYERFIYFFPNADNVPQVLHQIGMSYLKNGQFQEAARTFQKVIEAYPDMLESYFNISDAYLKLRQPDMAISVLEYLVKKTDKQKIRDRALYAIGWIYVEKASWENARQSFQNISEQNKEKYQADKIYTGLKQADAIEQKSPAVAGWLSVIPGAGFLYCGRYQDALTAFLLNAGLMLAAYESFKDDNYALGGVISFVELGFYAGNIYGAVGSTHKYNKAKTSEFIETLKANTKVSLSMNKDMGMMMAFRMDW